MYQLRSWLLIFRKFSQEDVRYIQILIACISGNVLISIECICPRIN